MPESLSSAQQQRIVDFCQQGAFFTPQAPQRIQQYWQVLSHWQQKNNLTGFTDFDTWLTQGIFDAYGLMSELEAGDRILDVGSGSGLPGLVVAICRDDVSVVAVERRQKRAAFLRAAAHATECSMRVIHGDVAQVTETFSVITARALSQPLALKAMTDHCQEPKTRWICPQKPIGTLTEGSWHSWTYHGHTYHWWVG